MKHLGDITKISGYDVLPVDVVIGGSPCQDLSVAGKRAGLAGERSGLFMEQIRLIKEMRGHDRNSGRTDVFVRPRFMVWENVPGAFSSNKGEDFRAVLEETARVAQPDAVIPGYEDGWRTSGCILGRGWSIAWRVLDAQFWGVPQRRRRIALVADFGGHAAPEILFVRKGVCGDFETSGETREVAPAGTGTGAYPPVARSLTARYDGSPCIDRGPNIIVQDGVKCLTPWDTQSARVYGENGAWHSLNANENGGQSRDAVLAFTQNQRNEVRDLHDVAGALAAEPGMKQQTYICESVHQNQCGEVRTSDVMPTLSTNSENRVTDYTAVVTCGQTRYGEYKETDVGSSLKASGGDYQGGSENIAINGSTVRRLTPLECERLQGFPDGWTDIGEWTDTKGKRHDTSDAARYKALGNSIAIPPWSWVLKRICACYERTATMASLFDGISGFVLIWTRLNGFGSVKWTSEIEEFPIAVCKRHFGDETTGEKGDYGEKFL